MESKVLLFLVSLLSLTNWQPMIPLYRVQLVNFHKKLVDLLWYNKDNGSHHGLYYDITFLRGNHNS